MRVGALGYATCQGIGYLLKDFTDHGVVDDVLLKRYPRDARENHVEWYPPGTPLLHGRDLATQHHKVVRDWFGRIDVALFFESPLDWGLLRYARSLGKKTAIVVMYEWWPEQPPALPDLLLCPSDLDYDVFTKLEEHKVYHGQRPRIEFLPVPAPDGTWRRRTTARRFLHNAGHVGSRNHKGTDTLLAAMRYVESPIELTVRCQSSTLLDRLFVESGLNPRDNTFQRTGANGQALLAASGVEIPRDHLFGEEFDVYVAPERYNGLSLPLQEAFAAGMPVVTTDRYPANTWLPREPLVPVASTRRVRVAPGHLEIDESVVEPRALARVLDGLYGQDVTRYSDAGKAWAEENSWAVLGPKYRVALEGLL